jgi:hypothetical protein
MAMDPAGRIVGIKCTVRGIPGKETVISEVIMRMLGLAPDPRLGSSAPVSVRCPGSLKLPQLWTIEIG